LWTEEAFWRTRVTLIATALIGVYASADAVAPVSQVGYGLLLGFMAQEDPQCERCCAIGYAKLNGILQTKTSVDSQDEACYLAGSVCEDPQCAL
ncbi:hypothetical protein cypCar_00009945, partial [Cyprinus carpio]